MLENPRDRALNWVAPNILLNSASDETSEVNPEFPEVPLHFIDAAEWNAFTLANGLAKPLYARQGSAR